MKRVPLSPRQLEVAKLLSRGFTHAEIASELGVSRRTVDDHAAALRRKTGESTSRKAAGAAL